MNYKFSSATNKTLLQHCELTSLFAKSLLDVSLNQNNTIIENWVDLYDLINDLSYTQNFFKYDINSLL